MTVLVGVASAHAESVLVLVRHAEKVDESEDPELSRAGKARSLALASLLEDAGIETIYSTGFIRTRDTARPLAERLGIAVRTYDPDALEDFAAELRRSRGRALVVGHSDTTGELVEFLGGDAGSPIEDGEYDRLYLLLIPDEGEPVTTLLRFSP